MRRAGDYPYERELTLHKAITMASGFTDKAATSRAKVIRKN
jgi:protein involved in polysaccharide export with SLBB domain